MHTPVATVLCIEIPRAIPARIGVFVRITYTHMHASMQALCSSTQPSLTKSAQYRICFFLRGPCNYNEALLTLSSRRLYAAAISLPRARPPEPNIAPHIPAHVTSWGIIKYLLSPSPSLRPTNLTPQCSVITHAYLHAASSPQCTKIVAGHTCAPRVRRGSVMVLRRCLSAVLWTLLV